MILVWIDRGSSSQGLVKRLVRGAKCDDLHTNFLKRGGLAQNMISPKTFPNVLHHATSVSSLFRAQDKIFHFLAGLNFLFRRMAKTDLSLHYLTSRWSE